MLKPGGEIVLVSRVGAEAGLRAHGRALVRAGRAQARLAHRVPVGALRALGHARRGVHLIERRADAAARAFLADPLRQGSGRRHRSAWRVSPAARLMRFKRNAQPWRNNQNGKLSGRTQRTALGRPPLLPPQPHQPVAASASARSSFLCAYVLMFTDPADGGADRLAGRDDDAARSATSSSSRRATTRSTRRPTSTRKRSRSATTCAARSCC